MSKLLDGKLYFYTDKRKAMYHQMVENPSVSMTFMVTGGFVRLSAESVFDQNVEAKKAILNENPVLTNLYTAEMIILKSTILKILKPFCMLLVKTL